MEEWAELIQQNSADQIDAILGREKTVLDDCERVCILDGCRGIYLPQDFATNFNTKGGVDSWTPEDGGISDLILWQENIKILETGPDHEHYWEAWDEICADACMVDDKGITWRLYQDGDLFAWYRTPGQERAWQNQ